MPDQALTPKQSLRELNDLRARLNDAEEALRAIRGGEVDALMVAGVGGEQLFTLKDADDAYRMLIEDMSEGALTMTAQGLILFANRRFAEMIKTPLEKVIGATIHTWIAPDSQAILQSLLGKDADEKRREQLVLSASDGTRVPVYLSVSKLRIKEMPDAFGLVATDLTDQKRREAIAAAAELARELLAAANQSRRALLSVIEDQKRAEELLTNLATKFRTIYESSSDAIMLLDEKGFFDCNPATLLMFGCATQDDFISKNLSQLCPPTQPGGEDSMRLANQHIATASKSGSHQFEWLHCRSDGTEFPADVLLTAMQLDGKPVLQATVRDISERKRAHEALARNERYYRKMIEGGTDVFFLVDRAGTLLYGSESGKQLTGWETADLLGKPVTDFVSAQSLPVVGNAMADALAKPAQLIRLEVGMLRKDGTQVETDVLARNLLDDPDVAGIVITARDISKRKAAEEELRRMNRALHTLSACNEALVRAADESRLLESICRLIVETGGYRMGWVGVPEQNAAKTVRPLARYGHDEGYLAAANISWADNELGRGPTGTAIRTGTIQINQNFRVNPAFAPWREAALARGYQSSIALPLKSAEGMLGTLTLYASEPDAFDATEVTLLQELADDLAFGIETLRTRAERDRIAHEQLHHTEILRQSLEDSIKAIANTVEMRDPYTAGHQRRVGQLAVAIARELAMPDETTRGIELAASIHDLGKIRVPAEILAKPGKLTAIEFMLLKDHAQVGFDILKDIKFPWPIATMVLQHHERQDGSGYPQGLKGEQILLESRIMAVADVVEAMASHRPYRAALGVDIALKEIEQGRGTVYDAAVVDACIRLFAEKRFAFSA